MTAHIGIYGRLGNDPRPVETKTGKAMTVATLAVEAGDESDDPLWFGVVAFNRQAEALLKHAKGEPVSVSGRLQRNRWTNRDGEERERLQVVADAIVSARTVRPGGGKKKQPARPEPELDDDIGF